MLRQVLLVLFLLLVGEVCAHLLHVLLIELFIADIGISLVIHGALRTEVTAKRLLLLLILRLHGGLVWKALTAIASIVLLAALLLASRLPATVVLSFALLCAFFELSGLAVLFLLELLCLHLVEARVVPLVFGVCLRCASHGVVAASAAWLIMVVSFAVAIAVGSIAATAPSLVA